MSKAPDRLQRVLAKKWANALIADAQPTGMAKMLSGGASGLIFEGFRKTFGGLWVGGTVTLTEEELSFAPNALNRAVHVGVSAKTIPLANVVRATDRFGWFTRIVDVVQTDGSVFVFRCYGAKPFADKITAATESLHARGR
jgi:hypothetical protein